MGLLKSWERIERITTNFGRLQNCCLRQIRKLYQDLITCLFVWVPNAQLRTTLPLSPRHLRPRGGGASHQYRAVLDPQVKEAWTPCSQFRIHEEMRNGKGNCLTRQRAECLQRGQCLRGLTLCFHGGSARLTTCQQISWLIQASATYLPWSCFCHHVLNKCLVVTMTNNIIISSVSAEVCANNLEYIYPCYSITKHSVLYFMRI